MRRIIQGTAKAVPIVMPVLFVLFFLGYFMPCYDIVLNTSNVVGNGNCIVNISAPRTYAYNYNLYAPINNEQSTVIVKGVHYDVTAFDFAISDINEADFQNYEVRWFGLLLAHIDFKNTLTPGEYGQLTFCPTSDGESVHVVVDQPKLGFTLKVNLDYVKPWHWAVYWAIFILLLLMFSVGLGMVIARFPSLHFPLMSFAAIVAVLLAGCFICNSLADVEYTGFLLNAFILFGLSLILGAFTTPLIGSLAVIAITLFAYIANYFTILFRGRPIMPADLIAIGTAKEVLGGYNFSLTWQMGLGISISVAYAIGLTIIWKLKRHIEGKAFVKHSLIKRALSTAIGVIILVLSVNNSFIQSIDKSAWDSMALFNFQKHGMFLTFVNYARNSFVKKPEGYSREAVNRYLNEYLVTPNNKSEKDVVRPTNIIMVMNEAFSDLRTAGMNEKIDVMPFIDSLQDNTVEGSLYVSVIGGGTCNTEFEAMTGNTLAFLGSSNYPYSQYLIRDLFSLASYYKKMGYTTTAFHPNEARNWNRDNVYPLLGFDVFHSIDDYPQATAEDYIHNNYSDLSNYRFMENVIEENNDTPQFSLNVTMQNHSSYDSWENLKEAESVKENAPDLEQDAQVYLSLIKVSDDAVKQLIETYQKSDKPTMIIFFGDHQPSLSYEAGLDIYGTIPNPLALLHTKFFIWTNYESEPKHGMSISANYMPWLIMERAGFSLPPFVQMLKEVHEKYPIISTAMVVDSVGTVYNNITELMDDPLIRKYQYIQYANLFDEIDPAWFEVK